MPLLRKEGIYLLDAHEDLNEEQARFVDRYFMEKCISGTHPRWQWMRRVRFR